MDNLISGIDERISYKRNGYYGGYYGGASGGYHQEEYGPGAYNYH